MGRYLLNRLLLLIPTLLGVTLVVFLALRFLPGDVVTQMLGDYGQSSPEIRREMEQRLGLTGSLPEQYLSYLGDLATGDLGTSLVTQRSVWTEIETRLPVTAELGIMVLMVSMAIGLPIGTLSAIKQDTPVDYAARTLAILLLAVPNFWVALMVLIYGFQWFGWTPPLRYVHVWENPIENLRLLWAPALILGGALSGSVMRMTRSTILEVLRQDYVRTARAKGLRSRAVVSRHVLPNALIPVITIIGLQVPIVVGGTVVLEQIFSLPGMGSLLLNAISFRDYPMVQGIVLITSLVVILTNLLVDLSYPLLDPRIRY